MPPTATGSLIFVYLVVSLLFLLLVPPSVQVAKEDDQEVVCSNIDIRNEVSIFKKLENCTVVEGFVRILLLDVGNEFESLSFPKLREITDYLLFYRTFGLLSMERLFPNLAVIRGRTLFFNYALVVFEMFQLQEIGLRSLTDIVRGSVRIEKNPNLCYVATVDWDRIARQGAGEHFIKENKHLATCPTCSSHGDCPLSSSASGKPTYLCWNSDLCQKVCPEKCLRNDLACNSRECCHKECLGGCTGRYNTNCTACRNVAYEGRCMKKCPPSTFEYMERRCISEEQCKNMSHFIKTPPDSPPLFFKPFNGQCKPNCPKGFTENASNPYHCIPCKGSCPKICTSSIVTSVASAQKLKGCTYINGSLQIQIKGGKNVVHELEKNLNSIQEIRGYLKIIRSYPIKSLNFLKDLTTIHGEILEQNAYSLFVLDNQNLQELWDWANREKRLRILKGKVFFHFNSKLCPEKINELKKYADVIPWDDRDVSPNSNGDKVACEVFNINLTFTAIQSELVLLKWYNFKKNMTDPRNLLGYVVHYKEAPEQNITIFDGRDACGDDVWKVNDVEVTNMDYIFHPITHLKPFTQYAVYIRTYTLASAPQGAQSNIHYVRTLPDTPSPPQSISAHSTSSSNIVISWLAPKRPNGIVTHYLVNVIQETDSSEFINKRNYCIDPLNLPDIKNIMEEEEANERKHGWTNGTSKVTANSTDYTQCCSCGSKSHLDDGEVAQAQVVFEDYLHNMVYYKNPDAHKYINNNRSSNSSLRIRNTILKTTSPPMTTEPLDLTTLLEEEITHGVTTPSLLSSSPHEDSFPSNQTEGRRIQLKVHNDTMQVIPNLRHFTEYTIEVMACLDEIPHPSKSKCSTKAITSVRTLPLGGMDDVDARSIFIVTENATKGMVTVHWKEPLDPNGLVVSYNIEYKKADGDGHKPITVCMPRVEYQAKSGYSLTGLSPGNYSLSLRTTSLAGNGNWTKPIYFIIPQATNSLSTEIIVVVSLACFIVAFLILGAIYIRKKRFSIPEEIIYASINPEYMSTGNVYKPDEWEVAREKITLLRELGQGSFGMVYEGEARDLVPGKPVVPCAVKTVNDNATYKERLDFLMEASVMKAFDCHHVVKLLGVVSQSHPTLVIMELMSNGDLKSYLRSHRPDNEEFPDRQPPTLKMILQMAAEIADGMSYLAFNKFVHRDLAARNCMVAHDLTVKIGDFGMTRDIYETDYYRKGGKGLLPVRWMAPESLKDGVFTTSSDVWSYGVVLWEMATLASQPYQGFSNEQVLQYVLSGGYMPQPEDCPQRLYDIMLRCWNQRPSERPTFEQLIELLLPDVNEKFLQVSFYATKEMERSAPLAEDEVEASPSTPLRSNTLQSSSGEGAGVAGECEGSEVRFFPSSALDSSPDEPIEPRVVFHTTSDGSKGLSSDGSKGSSKGSSNNGSLANGHVPRTTATMC